MNATNSGSAKSIPAAPDLSRIAVLASGAGSNLQAILDYFASGTMQSAASVVLVASNRIDAGALVRARNAAIDTHLIADGAEAGGLLTALHDARAGLLALAGYLKLVPLAVVHAFHGRMLNIHPALLPAFGGHGMYGQRVHAAVIASGARLSGVTVHFVNEHFDRGPIAAQWPVPVLAGDTPVVLAERVLRVEHALYPEVIAAVAAGVITLAADGRVVGTLPDSSAFATNVPNLFLR